MNAPPDGHLPVAVIATRVTFSAMQTGVAEHGTIRAYGATCVARSELDACSQLHHAVGGMLKKSGTELAWRAMTRRTGASATAPWAPGLSA